MTSANSGNWIFTEQQNISFGPGTLRRLSESVAATDNVLIVTSKGFVARGVIDNLVANISCQNVTVCDDVMPNPTITYLDAKVHQLHTNRPSVIVAIGGGSVLDAAKVISVCLPLNIENPVQPILQAEVELSTAVPVIAVPTTAGTGAEVTPFATVWDDQNNKKYSVAGPLVKPNQVVADPELTTSLPTATTLATGLDCVSHALESLWNKNRNPISEAYAVTAISHAIKALPEVLENPESVTGRANMMAASLLSGLAIAQTRTALAHSISYPLTSNFDIPHGLACSFTLPAILRRYLDSLNNDHEHSLLSDCLKMLESLSIADHIAEYASLAQIKSLSDQMYTKGRVDNFAVELEVTLDQLLDEAMVA